MVEQSKREYFVTNPTFQDLEGAKVFERDGQKMIAMTPMAARYWIEQGALSEIAPDKRSKDAQGALAQFAGKPLEEQKKPFAQPQPAEDRAAAKK